MNRSITKGNYEFDEFKHVHTLNGKNLIGTTTVLGIIAKPQLIPWAANEAVKYASANIKSDTKYSEEELVEIFKEAKVAHRKKKEKAGEAGTSVHEMIEKIIKNAIENTNGFIQVGPPENEQILRFVTWSIENKVKFLASEKHVYSEKMWIGGILDLICEIDGKRLVGDIKTSSGIYPEAYIQCSAYSECLRENEGEKIDGVVIINLKKDGGFDVGFNYDLEGNLECFKAALTLYKHMQILK
jgi:hypothetical protein